MILRIREVIMEAPPIRRKIQNIGCKSLPPKIITGEINISNVGKFYTPSKLTVKAPEDRPFAPKRTSSNFQPLIFRGELLVSGKFSFFFVRSMWVRDIIVPLGCNS